jgi:hypothetical protein
VYSIVAASTFRPLAFPFPLWRLSSQPSQCDQIGVSARIDTTGPRSYISNVSMRVFGSTGEPGGRRESGTEDS